MLAGFDGAFADAGAQCRGGYIPLKSFEEREKLGVDFAQIMAEAQKRPPTSTRRGC